MGLIHYIQIWDQLTIFVFLGTKDYIMYLDHDRSGNDLAWYALATAQECVEKCNDTPACLGKYNICGSR